MPFLQKCAKKFVHFCCRAPRGARGLKFDVMGTSDTKTRSRPSRGAWIEIQNDLPVVTKAAVAPLAGRVD